MSIKQQTLDKLREFDTPTICNVIELFDIRPRNTGYMDHRIQSNFPEMPPMVGFATTACFRSDAPPTGTDVYGSLEQQIEHMQTLPGPAVVTIQDLDDPPVAAVFGEVMCSTYRGFGAAGLITSGAGRDLEQVRDLQFPVFTGSTIASHGYCHLLNVGATVRIGGLVVNPGDLLHGDANGVTNIPSEIASEVAAVADEFVATETVILEYVQSPGDKSVEEFTARRKASAEAVDVLKKKILG